MNALAGLVALLILAAFLGILALAVPSPDLLAVIALTVVLAAVDFVRSNFGRR